MITVLTAAGEVPLVNERAVIGNNAPPPLEAFRLDVEMLIEQATQWFDGTPPETKAQADEVGKLLAMIRDTHKGAEVQRKIEKEPHLEAGRAVDAAWKPLTDRLALAADTAKRALAPFLQAEQARIDAEAEQARKAAQDAQERAAREITNAALGHDFAARERAEETVKEAEKLAKVAGRSIGRAQVAGGARAVSLRDRWIAVLTDSALAFKHYKIAQPEALKEWLTDQAQRDVNAGARAIDGFQINKEVTAQ